MKVERFVHVNVVCTDLVRSLGFYSDVLGGTPHEIFESGDSDLRPCMGVDDDGAPSYRAALVHFGDARGGPYIDLVEWTGAELPHRRGPLAAQDLGLARVALQVSDMEGWVDRLEQHGVPLVGPVQEERVGPWNLRLLLCRDPDGTLIELAEFPQGQRRRYRDHSLERETLTGPSAQP